MWEEMLKQDLEGITPSSGGDQQATFRSGQESNLVGSL